MGVLPVGAVVVFLLHLHLHCIAQMTLRMGVGVWRVAGLRVCVRGRGRVQRRRAEAAAAGTRVAFIQGAREPRGAPLPGRRGPGTHARTHARAVSGG